MTTVNEKPRIDDKLPKIMTEPLPMILDELENYIRRVEDAVLIALGSPVDVGAIGVSLKS